MGGPAAPAALKPEEMCTLEGTVLKATDGMPLRRARILLRPAEGRPVPVYTSTNAEGRFTLAGVAPGRYRLYVERNGFVRQEYGQRATSRPGVPLSLAAGQKVRDLLFRLVPAGVVTGRVYDEEGEPAANVRIQVMRNSYVNGRKQLRPVGGASTNDLGEYRIFGLAPGRYYLSAVAGDDRVVVEGISMQLEESAEMRYAPVYYPGTSDPARAASITINAGDELSRMDFTLSLQRTVRIRGRVINTVSSDPRLPVQLVLSPRDVGLRGFANDAARTRFEEGGRFEIQGATPGSYVLIAHFMHENRPYIGREFVEVGGSDVEGVTLVIQPGVDVEGRLRLEGNSAARLDRLRVNLQPRDDLTLGGTGARINADGTFVMRGVNPGDFFLSVSGAPPDHYLKSVRLGGAEIIDAGFAAAPGKPASLEVIVSANAGAVEGQVLTDENLPAVGAMVVLVPEKKLRSHAQWYRTATTDQLGRFLLQGIRPGEYKLFAWDDVEFSAWLDPEFLAAYEEKGVKVSVAESARTAADLKLLAPRP
jgi:hypothetical protein